MPVSRYVQLLPGYSVMRDAPLRPACDMIVLLGKFVRKAAPSLFRRLQLRRHLGGDKETGNRRLFSGNQVPAAIPSDLSTGLGDAAASWPNDMSAVQTFLRIRFTAESAVLRSALADSVNFANSEDLTPNS